MIQNDCRLDSWKAIAAYLNRDVRTAIRWEKERHLPIHRMPGQKRSAVYAWASEIEAWLKSTSATAPASAATPVPIPTAQPRRRTPWIAALIGAIFLLGALIPLWRWIRPNSVVRLDAAVQITGDGEEKRALWFAGNSLFVVTRDGGHKTVTRLDQNGGREAPPLVLRSGLSPEDVSSDGSLILAIDENAKGCEFPLWIVPANGGPDRRLDGLCASTAAWSPDRQQLAFVTNRAVYLSKPDGTGPRKVTKLPSNGFGLRWSPNGKWLRLAVPAHGPSRLWQVSVDGSRAEMLLPGWSREGDLESGGRWTPDGKYFIFGARHNGDEGLWGIRERDGWFNWRPHSPFPLTTGTNGAVEPAFPRDGKRLFAIVTSPERGDLMRYDRLAKRFTSYPDGKYLSAAHLSFSPDGKDVAYVTHPDMHLWRMKADGTGGRMLIDHAAMPQWSPDGRTIAFMATTQDTGGPTKIRVISADGGSPVQPIASPEWQGMPSWTADGRGLIYGENGASSPIRASCTIHRFDFGSGRTSDLPGSMGLWTARACPTGRYMLAVTRDDFKLVLFDMRTNTWSDLAKFADSHIGANPIWSRDGKFIYVDNPDSPDPAIYRISVPDGRLEHVVSLKGVLRVRGTVGVWIGLTPTNDPLILRAGQWNQIFAWNWAAP
jgi:Tol biopolymer transport system component